jgi:ABC-type branched-subunit amino acid transport system ATPase component
MLTRMIVRNFKQFGEVEIELGQAVVFIGPNNSGKTTALQALVLWDIGLKRWQERRGGRVAPERRPGVTINRRDLVAVPVPDANLLWRNLHVRDVRKVAGKQQTRNVRVDIIVEGLNASEAWACGLEFDYANEESFYCRPLRRTNDTNPERMPVPKEASALRMAFLPPMSGLAASETRLDPGAINVRLGEGRTAEVLRNLCYQILMGGDGARQWGMVHDRIRSLFGVALDPPQYIPERGEVTMSYRNPSGVRLDLASTGRGLQQTLLLLAHLTLNPGSILLLDEPDAHLEILRQRQIYHLLTETAREQQSQIIAASHSEVVLNEAADRDIVVAFLGKPHRIDDRGSQLLKSLKDIGFEQYYQAEQQGWVLYLEGSTDLAILQAFADTLQHPAREALERPFVSYVENRPQRARDHFQGLREAKPDLVGFALFDRLDRRPQPGGGLSEYQWSRREIENYLCSREVLWTWAEREGAEQGGGPLFGLPWRETMQQTILEIEQALTTLNQGSPWSVDTKVTDVFLDPLFQAFFRKLDLPNLLRKTDYHVLARFVSAGDLDTEVTRVLDQIVSIASQARPVRTEDAER